MQRAARPAPGRRIRTPSPPKGPATAHGDGEAGPKRKAIAKEFQEYMVEKLYWNAVSGSPFYQVAQPHLKGYVFNREFAVHYRTVWLDR